MRKRILTIGLSLVPLLIFCACTKINTPLAYARAYCGEGNVAYDQTGGIWFVSRDDIDTTGLLEDYETLTEFSPVTEISVRANLSLKVVIIDEPQSGDGALSVCIRNDSLTQKQVQLCLQVLLKDEWYILPGKAGFISILVEAEQSETVELLLHDENPVIPGTYRLVSSAADEGGVTINQFKVP